MLSTYSGHSSSSQHLASHLGRLVRLQSVCGGHDCEIVRAIASVCSGCGGDEVIVSREGTGTLEE